MTNITLLLIISEIVVLAGWLIFKFLINLYRKPVLEINLSSLDNPKWSDILKVTDLVDSFLHNGFEAAGSYKCWEIPSLMISGFVRPSEQLTGIIYDHPTSGIWVDLCVQYADGGSLTVSNAPTGHEPDHMPQQTKIYCPGSSVDDLLGKVLFERKKTEQITVTKEESSSHFEDQYQKEMKWRIDRGGPTSLEVTRAANAAGESLDSERLQQATQKINEAWMKEKNKPKKYKSGPYEPVLPKEFQHPETFRQKMEQKGAPVPQLNVPALLVYLVSIAALAYWCSLNRAIGWPDRETTPLPESEFSRKFNVSGTDTQFAENLLNPAISDAILRLEELGQPFVEISHNSVGVEIEDDLSRPRKEAVHRKFLEEAERIIEATMPQAGQT